jgi:hypothetical protein
MTGQVHAMSAYRLFVVDEFDRVLALHWVSCADDVDAKAIAEALVSDSCGVEVWDVGRRVSKLMSAKQSTEVQPRH